MAIAEPDTESEHFTLPLGKEHKKRLLRYSKQQGKDQKLILEYLIDFAVFHDLNVHILVPRSRLAEYVTRKDFLDFKADLENVFIQSVRSTLAGEHEKDAVIKRMEERITEIIQKKDEQYNLLAKQLEEQIVINRNLREKAETNQRSQI